MGDGIEDDALKLGLNTVLHSARINGHKPYAHPGDVPERLPTHPASRIDALLPHHWPPRPEDCAGVLVTYR